MDSFTDYRERKEFYYGQQIKGLSAFLYAWLPLILIFAVWGFILEIFAYSGDVLGLIAAAIYVVFPIITWAFARGLDSSTFVCSISFLIYLIAQRVLSIIRVLFSASAFPDTTTGISVIDSAISVVFQLGMGLALFAEFADLLLISIFVAYYLHMFIRHKRFFTKSLAELRKDFEKKHESLKD